MPKIVTGGNMPQINSEATQTNAVHQEQQPTEPQTDTEQVLQPEQRQHVNVNPAQIQTPQIINNKVPVVVFVGPPSSGKSMILVRLAKYLRDEGYTIETDPTFLNTDDYQQDCQEFNDKLNTNIALKGSVKFLLVNVYKDGQEVAKLLEAPGEDFYTTDPMKIKAGKNDMVEPYLSTIITSNNRKSYVVLLDLDSEISFRRDSRHRDSYQQRFLKYFYPNIDKNKDRIILLYNKIDMTMFGNINCCDNIKGARDDAKLYYKQWFSSMKVSSFGGFISSENFVFKTFCTGVFSPQTDGFGEKYQTYNIANNIFPKELWKEITRKF
ncbi:MAG: hypothetical protein BHV69_07730 [Bacteroidales bacterium 52_46]|nr:MAG: hypothetical protein BHV69_07730 [Bacteroidales bacterium 52_46]